MFHFKRILFRCFRAYSYSRFMLLVVWLVGLFAGSYFAAYVPGAYFGFIRRATLEPVLFRGFAVTFLVAWIFSVTAFWLDRPHLFFPVVFLKAFFFSYSLLCVVTAFGDAGWMMSWLILFSENFSTAFLFWFWIKNIDGVKMPLRYDAGVCFTLSFLFFFIDYFVISPFAVSLIKY